MPLNGEPELVALKGTQKLETKKGVKAYDKSQQPDSNGAGSTFNSHCFTEFPIGVLASDKDFFSASVSNGSSRSKEGKNGKKSNHSLRVGIKARKLILAGNVFLLLLSCVLICLVFWNLSSTACTEGPPPATTTPKTRESYEGPYNLTIYSNKSCLGVSVSYDKLYYKTCTAVNTSFKAQSAMAVGDGCPGMKLWEETKFCVIGPWGFHWIKCGECTDVNLLVESVECGDITY